MSVRFVFTRLSDFGDYLVPNPYAFLRQVGSRLRKGERKDIKGPLPDGSGELTVRYAKFGDMLSVLQDVDALMAMAEEDEAAGRRFRGLRTASREVREKYLCRDLPEVDESELDV